MMIKKTVLAVAVSAMLAVGGGCTWPIAGLLFMSADPVTVQETPSGQLPEQDALDQEAQEPTLTVNTFCRSGLSQSNQQLYDQVLAGVQLQQAQIEELPKDLTTQQLSQIIQAVLADHPEIFWFRGAGTLTKKSSLWQSSSVYAPEYTCDSQEVASRQQRIAAAVSPFFTQAAQANSDYQRALAAYRFVINNTVYQPNAAENQNICSVFLGGASVCTGYAKSFQYLLQQCGIEAAYVTGTILADGENHAWVLMRLDGAYYYADPTFGDPVAGDGSGKQQISYDWFGLTTAELSLTHQWDAPQFWPLCTATAANYYQAEGLLLTEYERKTLANLLSAGYAAGEAAFSCKFADSTGYAQACDDLFAGQAVFRLLRQAGCKLQSGESVEYHCDDQKRIISIYL